MKTGSELLIFLSALLVFLSALGSTMAHQSTVTNHVFIWNSDILFLIGFLRYFKKYRIKILFFLITEFLGAPLILCPRQVPYLPDLVQALVPWLVYLHLLKAKIVSPNLSFYICEMGITTPTSQSCCEGWMHFCRYSLALWMMRGVTHTGCSLLSCSQVTPAIPLTPSFAELGVIQDFPSKP